jgi:hypothetical protein
MGLRIDQRLIIVTRQTRQQELTAKYGTGGQARFLVARARAGHAAGKLMAKRAVSAAAAAAPDRKMLADLAVAERGAEHDALMELASVEQESLQYQEIINALRQELDFDIPVQVVDRAHVPNMLFGKKDVIVAVGQDGLVANVAKYAVGLPIIGVNPDPDQYDGVLLPFQWRQARGAVQRALEGRATIRQVTLAQARLNDGQRLLAFNDLFIGARTHVSARYRLELGSREERQSSSGIIVATGAGSTGWLSSTVNMTRGILALQTAGARAKPPALAPPKFAWEERKLAYVVREPFASKTSSANLIAGFLGPDDQLAVESYMGPEGTIFSDGIEADFLPFPQGTIVTISVAKATACLVVP